MGLFFNRKKKEKDNQMKAFLTGTLIPIDEVGDGMFSEKVLGDGVAIVPTSNVLLAPADGKIAVTMDDSNHAVGIELESGIVVLLHIGLDTVDMAGDGFEIHVKMGDTIACGQPLITFDKEKIAQAGHKDVAMMVFTECEASQIPTFISSQEVTAGETQITK